MIDGHRVPGRLDKGDSQQGQYLIQGDFWAAALIGVLISDEESSCPEPFVIERGARSGPQPRGHRFVLDGIFWIARTGVAWRDLHEHFGKWSSVYRQFQRWTLSDLWDLVLEALNDTVAATPVFR